MNLLTDDFTTPTVLPKEDLNDHLVSDDMNIGFMNTRQNVDKEIHQGLININCELSNYEKYLEMDPYDLNQFQEKILNLKNKVPGVKVEDV